MTMIKITIMMTMAVIIAKAFLRVLRIKDTKKIKKIKK